MVHPDITMEQRQKLSSQANTVLNFMEQAGSITAREAMLEFSITSAALSRRIKDMKEVGIEIVHTPKRHPTTNQRYTRYSIKESKK